MSEELEHIDAIFSEKLKNYRKKPTEGTWDKLAMRLDQKQEKLNQNNKGKLGLLSITIISFMFIFSGHPIKTGLSIQYENHQPEEDITLSTSSKTPASEIIETEKEEAKPTVNQAQLKESIAASSSNTFNIIQEKTQNTAEITEKMAKQESRISSIDIEKKPLEVIQPQKRETNKRSKGIKIEITLDTAQIDKGAASPQTKKTFNTIFRKLRKFTEASKKN